VIFPEPRGPFATEKEFKGADSGKAERAKVAKYAVMIYDNSEGGAHGKQGEAARRPNEGANNAAPPRSEVLTRPPAFSATPAIFVSGFFI
jgi:hypothetical protein